MNEYPISRNPSTNTVLNVWDDAEAATEKTRAMNVYDVVRQPLPIIDLGDATNQTVNIAIGSRFKLAQTNTTWITLTNTAGPSLSQGTVIELLGTGTNDVVLQGSNLQTPGGGITFAVPSGPQKLYIDSFDGTNNIDLSWLITANTATGLVISKTNGPDILSPGNFGSLLVSDGSEQGWHEVQNFYRFFDDFTAAVAFNGDQNWTLTTAGGAVSVDSGEAGRPGIYVMGTSSSATGAPILSRNGSGFLFGGGKLVFTTAIKLGNLSTTAQTFTVRVGFADGAPPVDGAWFEYTNDDGNASPYWAGKTANNSNTSTANNGNNVPVGTGWHKLQLVVNAAGTQVDFYADGVMIGSSTTNIPTGTGRETQLRMTIIKSNGTTSRSLSIDYVSVVQRLTTTR